MRAPIATAPLPISLARYLKQAPIEFDIFEREAVHLIMPSSRPFSSEEAVSSGPAGARFATGPIISWMSRWRDPAWWMERRRPSPNCSAQELCAVPEHESRRGVA